MGVSHRGSCKIRMGIPVSCPQEKIGTNKHVGGHWGGKLGEAYGCMSQGSKDRG